MEFIAGVAGWAAFRVSETTPFAFARFSLRGSRLTITKLHLADDEGIGTDALRRLPLGRVEAMANGPYRAQLEDGWSEDEEPAPDRNVFPSPEDVQEWVGELDPHRFDDLLRSPDLPGHRERVEIVERWRESVAEGRQTLDGFVNSSTGQRWRKTLSRIRVPKTRPYPEDFYKQVANIYSALAAIGSKQPAVEIAEASKVPTSTVHRWVKEARRLNLLPEGQRGKRL
jgi:hypothetical protein